MRQQAVILQATTAVPDLRWNETFNCKPPIRIKILVTLADWGSKLIRQLVITTVHDADRQSLSIQLGAFLKKVMMMMKCLEEHP